MLDDANIRSELLLTPITTTIGDRSGYEESTETEGTAVIVFAIPSNFIKTRLGLEKFGDLEEGEIRFLIRDDQTVDTDDKVTYDSTDWSIRMLSKIDFNEVTCAQTIILAKRQ